MIPDFPFKPYVEQKDLYDFLCKELDAEEKTLSLLQLNTGGGKTLLTIAAVKNRPEQVVYTTKTFVEMRNVIREAKMFKYPPESALILGARSKLCAVDFVRDSLNEEEACSELVESGRCQYYAKLSQTDDLPPRVYDLEDMIQEGICPYYAARKFASREKLIVSSYNYLLDNDIKVLDFLESDSVIVFDEAHNLHSASCESLSVSFAKSQLDLCRDELRDAVNRLQSSGVSTDGVQIELLYQYSFILKELFRLRETQEQTIFNLENEVNTIFGVRKLSTDLIAEPMQILMAIQQVIGMLSSEVSKLAKIAELFAVIHENRKKLLSKFSLTIDFPFMRFESGQENMLSVNRSTLQLSCLDPGIALEKVIKAFKKVIFMSGTLAPFDFTLKYLNVRPICDEFNVRISTHQAHKRKNYRLFWCKTGLDRSDIFLDYRHRTDRSMLSVVVSLLNAISTKTCDGILLFFPSFAFLEEFIAFVHQIGTKFGAGRLIFAETSDPSVSDHAMNCHRIACELGRGSIFCAVSRGRYAEGIDIGSIYGRVCILLGVPFIHKNAAVLSQIEFCKSLDISEEDFVLHDACRISQQAIGRICREEDDYGCIVFVESRYRQIIRLLDQEAKEQGFPHNTGELVCQGIADFLIEEATRSQ